MKFLSNKKTNSVAYKNSGFTLIEMLVAVFIFSIIMTVAMGAIFSIVGANKNSQALKSVMDNLSSALESMSREIRYGHNYYCGEYSGNIAEFENNLTSCAEGQVNDNYFSFITREGDVVTYFFDETERGSIRKCINLPANNTNCFSLTAPEVKIKNLHFFVAGAERSNLIQPQVLMTVAGFAMAGEKENAFNIETMVTQRNLDYCKNTDSSRPPEPICPALATP